MTQRNIRKTYQGTVISNKMNKTLVVDVVRKIKHPKYGKLVESKKKYYVHAEGDFQIGQQVNIMQCRPISKLKRWRVI